MKKLLFAALMLCSMHLWAGEVSNTPPINCKVNDSDINPSSTKRSAALKKSERIRVLNPPFSSEQGCCDDFT